jgi:hypothetical protein
MNEVCQRQVISRRRQSMNGCNNKGIVLLGMICIVICCAMNTLGAKEEVGQSASKEAKAIEVGESLSDNHPAVEEGVTSV